jgi:uncharacterized membrane protein YbaN (DUF454 family)
MNRVLRIVRFTIVAICLLLGIAGLILPILPGWIFFALAAVILFPEAAFARKLMDKISARSPAIGRFLHALQKQR